MLSFSCLEEDLKPSVPMFLTVGSSLICLQDPASPERHQAFFTLVCVVSKLLFYCLPLANADLGLVFRMAFYMLWLPQCVPAATAAESPQSCLTLCSPIPGVLQARTLEWVAMSFSKMCPWRGAGGRSAEKLGHFFWLTFEAGHSLLPFPPARLLPPYIKSANIF